MSRDNALFTVCGLLAGFIVGYFVASGGRAPSAAPVGPGTSAPAAAAASSGAPAAVSSSPELLAKVKDLQTALARDPQNADLELALANTYYDMADWSSAAQAYEKSLSSHANDPNVLTDLGSSYRNLGEIKKALDTYERAQKIAPSHAQSLLNMTLVYVFDLKDADNAQTMFDRLKKDHPELPRLSDLQVQISSLRAAKS
jgi:tetratricopeptide (TPR) repeat protein